MKSSHYPGNDWESIARQQAEAAARTKAAQDHAARLRVALVGAR